ncbi:MAG: tetratricopeptide repeat protein [Flavobacteriales bacterium]|nr:tetratricopeptide repeat protein [Flavobacteriales bacterium]MCB9196347.1 tetratricopeptide repeat protein [Flavobacteriales bacterium]
MKHIVLFACGILSAFSFLAQREDKITFNDGVAAYRDGEYKTALEQFEEAYAKNNKNARALYNAGNAAYLNGDFERAGEYYSNYAELVTSPGEKSRAYFNQGNTFLQQADVMNEDPKKLEDAQELYKKAVSSYKNSLKNNPKDPDAKYNLTYALDKIKKNEQQQQQQQEDQQQDQDQNQDNQDQEKNEDQNSDNQDQNGQNQNSDNENDQNQDQNDTNGDQDKDKEDQADQEEQNKDGDPKDEEKDGQGNPGDKSEEEKQAQISRAQAEQDLDAINEDEENILKKVYGSRSDKNSKVSSGKDW